MKNLQLISFLTLIFMSNAFGQTDCSELELKNEKLNLELTSKDGIIADQKEDISKLESENTYLKESLHLMNSKIFVEQDDFVLKINSVTGKSDNGVVKIEGIVENKGPMRAFRTSRYKTLLYDPKGNNYKASEIKFGNLDHLQEFQKNLPVKFTITFDKIGEEMPIIRNLTMVFTNRSGKPYGNMVFKNVSVQWE